MVCSGGTVSYRSIVSLSFKCWKRQLLTCPLVRHDDLSSDFADLPLYTTFKSACCEDTGTVQTSCSARGAVCCMRQGSNKVRLQPSSLVFRDSAKLIDSVDYTGFRETSRASISMSHDTAELTVSLEEAARIEKQTTSRLRKAKKLSLIVDLDQTIIHATVDPTVGDWMFDEKNPNYPVLRDVQRFKLLNDEGKEEGCWYYVKPRRV
jgi:hypothetical protein